MAEIIDEEVKKDFIFLIDKPYGWSSFKAVHKVKKQTGIKKVGHAGTLDPLATGLLIICTGKMTKSISAIQNAEKEYTGTFFLGATTPSYDLETEVNETFDISEITATQIMHTTQFFIGEVEQVPPVFSAIKVNGKRAYKFARNGEQVELKSRVIHIKEFEITRIELPEIDFRVVCSKGTYVRTLAHDFGKKLNNGIYLKKLRRTRIGEYKLDQNTNVFQFEKIKTELPHSL